MFMEPLSPVATAMIVIFVIWLVVAILCYFLTDGKTSWGWFFDLTVILIEVGLSLLD